VTHVALCQVNTIPGDIPGNGLRIRAAVERATALGADLAVVPEMALVGYSPRDLLFRRRFVEAAEEALHRLAADCRGLADMLVGTVRRQQGGGRPFANTAALISEGSVVGWADKTLLPGYDVFDEARYFEPALFVEPLPWRGRRLGVTVCEDIWTEFLGPDIPRYTRDPARELMEQGADVLINLSASPYHVGKPALREGLVARTAHRLRIPVLLCNLWGGNEEVLFDGGSIVADAAGRVVARGALFEEDTILVNLEAMGEEQPRNDLSATEEMRRALVCGLRDYAAKCGFSEVVIGLSGGVDSAVTACLAVDALGAGHVRGIAMPSPYSSEGSVRDAEDLARRLGIRFQVAPIAASYETLLGAARGVVGEGPFGVMEENLQARVRGALLMAVSNRTGALLVTTGNKSELAVGYCTLYGDMCGGLAAISDVYKTDVYALGRLDARAGRIPWASIEKPPSAELRPGQRDEDSLPPYEVLDQILVRHVDGQMGVREIMAELPETDRETVERVLALVARSEYKRRQAAPGLRVSSKAFGVGRRIPIVAASLGFLDALRGPDGSPT
jgi:NAD+ synthetase